MNGIFINTFYENASVLRWEQMEDGAIDLDVIPDHERFSPNNQVTHLNFKIEASPELVGKKITFRFRHLNGCWNSTPYKAFMANDMVVAVSYDGQSWENIDYALSEHSGCSKEFVIELKSETTQVARLVPYADSHLQKTISEIKDEKDVRVYNFASTVEGRPLEMIEIGNPDAKNRILLRGRAHPWESGGSWLLEGLMRHLALGDGEEAAEIKKDVCFSILPMAAKDGVYRGMTRFNIKGIDLNRNWAPDTPPDPKLAPENAGLLNWLYEQKRLNKLPQMAICIHNDSQGGLHLAYCENENDPYRIRMLRFESILKKRTWFTEGATNPEFHNPGSFSDGLKELFGIDAMVFELRAIKADGLGYAPLHDDWINMGQNFAKVVWDYFKEK